MKLMLYGRSSYDEFTQQCPDVTAVDFPGILGEISKAQPQLVLDLCSDVSAKRYLADAMEQVYGTVALYGTPIIQDITADMGSPIFVQEHTDPAKYEAGHLTDVITKQYKKTNHVYTDLQRIHLEPGKTALVTPLEFMALVVYENKEGNMTIEESIRAAMLKLGVTDADGNPLPPKEDKPETPPPVVDEPQPKPTPAPKPKKTPPAAPPQPKKVSKTLPVVDTQQKETPAETVAEVPENIYCKIEDNHLALIIPDGLQMEQKTIAGAQVRVLTMDLPDWTNEKLQALKVLTPQKPVQTHAPKKEVKRQPIVAPKPKAEPAPAPKVDPVELNGNLAELSMEKERLTEAIADARAAGDEQLVLALRKQRRAVRAQINKLKE